MQVNFQTENKEKSQVLLTITVGKDEVKKEYDSILNKTKKEVAIKGFRKGKVPNSILESKFKKSFLAEASNKVIDEAYKEVVEQLERKPLNYATPKMEEFELPELDKDYTFQLTYETEPEIKIGEYKGIEIEKDELTVSEEDIKSELENMTRQFANIEEKEKNIEDGDIALVEYTVFEDENEFDKKENEYVHVGKDFDVYKLGKKIMGLDKGQETEFTKKFAKKEIKKIAGKTLTFKLKVKEIKREVVPALDDKLASQIDKDIKTADELKAKLEENMKNYAEGTTKNSAIETILDKITETFEGEIPQAMIDYQIDNQYKEMLQRMGGDENRLKSFLKVQNKTIESFKEDMSDDAVKLIKRSLILKKVADTEKFEVTEEEIKEHIGKMAKQFGGKFDVDEFFESYKKQGALDMFKEEIATQKAIDFLYDNANATKVNKMTLEEFKNKNSEEK